MPKMKTHRGAAKRFRITRTGKVLRGKAFDNHMLGKKNSRRKRRLEGVTVASAPDAKKARRLLGK